MKYKWKLHPCDYSLGWNEKFYSDMEARGWRFVKRRTFRSKFQRCEPTRTRYRVEVSDTSSYGGVGLPEEQLEVFRDCGWEYVTSRGMLHYFRAPQGSDAPEFYQDPRQQAETLKGVRKRLFIGALINISLLTLLVSLIFTAAPNSFAVNDSIRKRWLQIPGLVAYWAPLLLSGIIWDTANDWSLQRAYRRMKRGIPLDHAPRASGRVWSFLALTLRVATVLCLLTAVYQLVTLKPGPLPEESDGPYIVLSDIGWESDRTDFMGRESILEHTRNPFSEYWFIREFVKNPGKVDATIYQDIYRLAPWLDPMDWVDAVADTRTRHNGIESFTPVTVEGLDHAWVLKGGVYAIALKGRYIASITYLDGEYSTDRLIQIMELLASRWPTD